MVTITETSGDVASMVDDIATAAGTASGWSDADTGVTNSGASDAPEDNGRVFSNSNTGTFLFFYVTHGEVASAGYQTGDALVGVRFIHSTNWDTNAHRPAGLTDVVYGDADDGYADYYNAVEVLPGDVSFDKFNPGFSVAEGNDSSAMWDNLERGSRFAGRGGMVAETSLSSRTAARSYSATYFGSVRPGGLTLGVWNTTDGTDGIASSYSFEWLDSKFYDDGELPVVITYNDSAKDDPDTMYSVASYGFREYGISVNAPHGTVGSRRGNVRPGEWGVLNPDADDDTFFFRRAVVSGKAESGKGFEHAGYRDTSSAIYLNPKPVAPVGFVGDTIPNQPGNGLAHGDTVTEDGTSYRAMVQSGSSRTYDMSIALRYE